MPRNNIDLEPFQESVQQWLDEGLKQGEIRDRLQQIYGVCISLTTLQRKLQQLGLSINRRPLDQEVEATLRIRIAWIFYHLRLIDETAIQFLEIEGFDINQRKLAEIRRQMGLHKRTLVVLFEEAEKVV